MFMPEDMQEQLLCFTIGKCELHKLIPKNDGQLKQCEFMNASVHITSVALDDDDGVQYSVPIVVITNDDYDKDQDQKQEEKLPITENLIFMRYEFTEDDDNAVEYDENGNQTSFKERTKIGFVFYYPELNVCSVIETDPQADEEQRELLQDFEQWISKILYIINERKVLRERNANNAYLI